MLSKKEKLIVLANLEDMAFEAMSSLGPTDDGIIKCITAIHSVRQLAEMVAYTDSPEAMIGETEDNNPTPEKVAKQSAPAEEPYVEETPFEASEKAAVSPEKVSRADVRVALVAAGSKAKSILNDAGYEKLSLVPDEMLGDIYRRAMEAN